MIVVSRDNFNNCEKRYSSAVIADYKRIANETMLQLISVEI